MAKRYVVFGIELCEPLDLTLIAPPHNPRQGATRMSRNWDGGPETEVDRRFHDLRESGYDGPIDQDGYAVGGDYAGFDVPQADQRVIVRTLVICAVLAVAAAVAFVVLHHHLL